MADGRRNEKFVARFHPPVHADLTDERMNRVMAVHDTFGAAGGAGGIHDHAHRIRIKHRQGAGRNILEQRMISNMRPAGAAQDNDLRWRVKLPDDACQHRRALMATKLRGNKDHPAVDVLEHETQIVLAQRGQDRVRDHAGQRCRQVNDGGLVPVGQHEGDYTASRIARCQELCQGQCLCMQAAGVKTYLAVNDEYAVGLVRDCPPQRVCESFMNPQSLCIGRPCTILMPAE